MPAGEAAAQSLIFKGFHGHDADIVGPGLDGLAYAGDGARAAHADGDGVHETAALPGDGLHDGGAGHPAMVFGVAYVVDNVAAVTSTDANRAAQRVLATDAIPASPAAGAALHAAAQLIATGTSRSALAIFSGRQNLSF